MVKLHIYCLLISAHCILTTTAGRDISRDISSTWSESTYCPLASTALLFPAAIDSGVIRSPNYPKNYPSALRCTYRIEARAGWVTLLKVVDFETECDHDILVVQEHGRNDSSNGCVDVAKYNGPCHENRQLTYTGVEKCSPRRHYIPWSMLAFTGEVHLLFTTDYALALRGFELRFERVQTKVFSNLWTEVTSAATPPIERAAIASVQPNHHHPTYTLIAIIAEAAQVVLLVGIVAVLFALYFRRDVGQPTTTNPKISTASASETPPTYEVYFQRTIGNCEGRKSPLSNTKNAGMEEMETSSVITTLSASVA